MNLRILRSRWLGVAAVLLAVIVIAACGADPTPTPEPTTTPEPTATPEPTPEPTQPPLTLENLRITSETTGQDLVAHISEAEAACLSSATGDANFQLFQAAPLLASAANESAKALFAGCLQDDNFPVIGVGLMSANLGGWSEDTLACVTDLSKTHPELVYVALGVEGYVSDPSHPTKIHSILLDMYECLNIAEEVEISIAMISASLEIAPFSGQDLIAALSETDLECLQTSLPEAMFAMIAGAPSVAGGEIRDAPPQVLECISAGSLNRITGGILANSVGATSDASHACMVEFAANHSHYIDLVRAAAADPEALTPEEYVELAEDGFKIFNCMNVEELAMFQNTYLPRLLP